MINNDGNTIASVLAADYELTLDIINLLSEYDFDYLHQYIGRKL